MRKKTKTVTINDPLCADFYIKQGCKIVGTGIYATTHCAYWIFDRESCSKAYIKWLIRLEEIKDANESEENNE